MTRKDYVDQRVDGLLVNADGYRFAPSGVANAFAIVKLSNSSEPFVIQTDVGSASIITVQNDLRLAYSGTKTLTNDSIMRYQDVQALIAGGGSGYPAYYAFRIAIGDVPSGVESFTSTSNLITTVNYNNISSTTGYYEVLLSGFPFGLLGADNYEVMLSVRSGRLSISALDNDIVVPFIALKGNLSFNIVLEESVTVVQNIIITGMIVKVPA